MSLNGAIGEHSTGSYTVTRTPERTYNDQGRLLPAATPSTFPIDASVQPATPEQLTDVPESQGTDDALLVLTETALYPRVEGGYEGDTIVIRGRTYRVHSVEHWEHWGETHYEAIVLKMDSI